MVSSESDAPPSFWWISKPFWALNRLGMKKNHLHGQRLRTVLLLGTEGGVCGDAARASRIRIHRAAAVELADWLSLESHRRAIAS
jgi:hypothetical protein